MDLPPSLLNHFIEKRTRLEARENLNLFNVLSMAFGKVRDDIRDGILTRWAELAAGMEPSVDPQGRTYLATADDVIEWFRVLAEMDVTGEAEE